MSTFNSIISVVENIVSSNEYKDLQIATYPSNYQGKITPIHNGEWVRLNVLPFNSQILYNDQRKSGQIVCNIFVPAGRGIRRATQISDLLDGFFGNLTISGADGNNNTVTIQTTNSFITTIGTDPINKGLYRIDYTVNFNNYQ